MLNIVCVRSDKMEKQRLISSYDENFAKNVLDGIGDYKDFNTNYDGYWHSFVEKDARKAGALIEMAIRNY